MLQALAPADVATMQEGREATEIDISPIRLPRLSTSLPSPNGRRAWCPGTSGASGTPSDPVAQTRSLIDELADLYTEEQALLTSMIVWWSPWQLEICQVFLPRLPSKRSASWQRPRPDDHGEGALLAPSRVGGKTSAVLGLRPQPERSSTRQRHNAAHVLGDECPAVKERLSPIATRTRDESASVLCSSNEGHIPGTPKLLPESAASYC